MQAMVEEQLRLQQTNRALEDMDKQRVRPKAVVRGTATILLNSKIVRTAVVALFSETLFLQ